MRQQYIIFFFLTLSAFCYGQSNFSFSIKQVGLPGVNFSDYKYNNGTLLVLKNTKKISKVEFTNQQKNKLDSLIADLHVENLQAKYCRSVLIFDGIHWTFNFKNTVIEKEIYLDNYYLESLDEFIRFVNSNLPEKAQIISLGQDMHLKPDTIIYHLPDFYVDTVILPDTNYNFYRVMCFKKGYFYTDILDSISLCDCRIYPKDINNSEYLKRHFWRAWRQKNNTWKREYFDNKNNVFKTDYIKDIIPYQIVKEVINNDIGAKPSVTIYRYYRTETNEK